MTETSPVTRRCACGETEWKEGAGYPVGHSMTSCQIDGAGWVPRLTFEKSPRELIIIAAAEMDKVKGLEAEAYRSRDRETRLEESLSVALESLAVQQAAVRAMAAVIARSEP